MSQKEESAFPFLQGFILQGRLGFRSSNGQNKGNDVRCEVPTPGIFLELLAQGQYDCSAFPFQGISGSKDAEVEGSLMGLRFLLHDMINCIPAAIV